MHDPITPRLVARAEAIGNDPDAGYAGIHVRIPRHAIPGTDEELWWAAARWYYEEVYEVALPVPLLMLHRAIKDPAHRHRGPYVAFRPGYAYVGVYDKTYHLVRDRQIAPSVRDTLGTLAGIARRIAPGARYRLGVVDVHAWSAPRLDAA